MKQSIKTIITTTGEILGISLSVFFLTFVVLAWTGPSSTPPICPEGEVGCDEVLHTGSTAQSKAGGLLLNTGGATNGLIVEEGNVGIGTTNPDETLSVIGSGKFSGSLAVGTSLFLPKYSSKPNCGSEQIGSLLFDTIIDKPFICTSFGWKPLDSDFDSDGLTDWLDNNDNNFNDVCSEDNNGYCYINSSNKSDLDSHLIANNIKKDVNIFGITGSLEHSPPSGWNGLCIFRTGNYSCPTGYSRKYNYYSGCTSTSCSNSGGGYYLYQHGSCSTAGWVAYRTSTSCDNYLVNYHNDDASSSKAKACSCSSSGGSPTGIVTVCCQ